MSKELNKAPVEQAGGDERAAFEFFVRKHCGMPEHIAVNWDAKFTNDAWEGWKARAALAQPSPAQADEKPGDSILCYGCFAKGVGPDHFDEAGKCLVRQQTEPLGAEFAQVLSDNLPELLSTAQAEQAEAERPKIVATLFTPNEKVHDDIGFKAFAVAGDCDKDGGEFYDPEKLMTVAQHDRIVGELRAVIAQLRQHKNDYMDSGQETYRALQNEIREREAEIARLDGLVSGRTAERDAAQARVAELERKFCNEENAHTTTIEQRDNAEHWADQLAKAIAERFGVDIGEHSNLNCPWNEALVWMQQPPAQAQHSVPAYVSYTTRPAESLAGIALRQLKEESRWVEIRDINAPAFPDMQSHSYYPAGTVIKLPAAAPGKSVPQAWLDVQVERRRQVEAEGWTPEHDDEHDSGELAAAGAAYALHAADHLNPYSQGDGGDEAPSCWPWHDGIAGRGEGPEKTEPAWWKPSTPRRDLVKACALALAEIERLDRAAAPGKEGL
ncbi:TPA: hypothetical protein ACSPM7_005427 [Pseudomonas aeruginosa]